MLESVMPTKKQVLLLCCLALISSLVIFFAPQRHRPQVIMISLLSSTLIFAVYTAITQANEEMKEAKKAKAK
eukprot:symbB.v1.2.039155.t1/scaffold6376.1/size18630/1